MKTDYHGNRLITCKAVAIGRVAEAGKLVCDQSTAENSAGIGVGVSYEMEHQFMVLVRQLKTAF